MLQFHRFATGPLRVSRRTILSLCDYHWLLQVGYGGSISNQYGGFLHLGSDHLPFGRQNFGETNTVQTYCGWNARSRSRVDLMAHTVFFLRCFEEPKRSLKFLQRSLKI